MVGVRLRKKDMDEITKGIHEIYDTREKYIIIGLTGRTGSGCSKSASILAKPISKLKLARPKSLKNNANESRKYLIIKRFIQNNWEPFVWIKIKDIITSFILEIDKELFIEYISKYLEEESGEKGIDIKTSFLKKCGQEYENMRSERLELQKK